MNNNHVSQGTVFPRMEGTSLQIQPVTIPPQSAADLTLVLLGFTHVAGQQMEPWVERFKRAFTGRQLDYYKIAMVGDLPDPELEAIVEVMVIATPPEERPHVVAVKGNAPAWRQQFGVKREKDTYLFLLDRSGVVQWKGVGPWQRASFNNLVQAGQTALGSSKNQR